MPTLIDIAWLIPALPFCGATLLAVLLISFRKTMNRLSKPVGFILFTCMGISTTISYILLSKELTEEIVRKTSFNFSPGIRNLNLDISILIDKFGSIMLSVACTVIIISMLLFHINRAGKKGYVMLFISLVLFSSTILSIPLSTIARSGIEKFIS